jgi:hypothetical protein
MGDQINPPNLIRAVLFVLVLALLALGQFLLRSELWGGELIEATDLPTWWNCFTPSWLCQWHYPSSFAFVFIGFVCALALHHEAVRASNAPSELNAFSPAPLTFTLGVMTWRRVCRVFLSLSFILTLWLAYTTLTVGNPPVTLWLLALITVGATLYCADRAAQHFSLFARREPGLLIGYVVGLLALGYVFRYDAARWLIVGLGVVLALWLWRRRLVSAERIAFSVLVLCAFALYTFDLQTWRYAYIGDEYAFYEFANNILSSIDQPYALSPIGAYNVHPVLATYTQIGTMLLYGNDVYGWRVSETLAVMLAALPLYVFMRAFMPPRAALLGLVVYLSSHHLLGLSKVGYTYSQLLVPITSSLALLTLALRRGSLLGVFASGVASAFAFYTFAFGIPFISLPLLLWALHRPLFKTTTQHPDRVVRRVEHPSTSLGCGHVRKNFFVFSLFILAVGLTAMPSLANAAGLQQIVRHTVANTEVKAANPLTQQIIPNILYTLTASLTFLGRSHYVSGAHLDVLSSILMLLGMGGALVMVRRNRMMMWLCVSFVLACVFVGGFAPYPYPPIARTYILVPFYALFAGIGSMRLQAGLATLTRQPRVMLGVWLLCCMLIPMLNLWHFFVAGESVNPQESPALLLKEMQAHSPQTTFYLVAHMPYNQHVVRVMLKAYNLDANRLLIIPDDAPAASLTAIQHSRPPYVILVSWPLASRDRWLTQLRALWPERIETLVSDGTNLTHFAELVVAESMAAPSMRATAIFVAPWSSPFVISAGQLPRIVAEWPVLQPRDVAFGPDGLAYVINGARHTVDAYTLGGKLIRTLSGGWREPFALAFNARRELLVLDAYSANITRIRTDGTLIVRSHDDAGLFLPRGFTLAPNGDVYVADTGNGRIVRFNHELLEPTTVSVTVPLSQPTSLTFIGEQLVIADDPWLYVFSPTGELRARWVITESTTTQPPHFLDQQPNLIVMTDPERGEVQLFDLQGRLLQTLGPPTYERMRKPQGLAITPDGRLLIADHEGNVMRVMEWK